jgi:hypothetical protein
VEFELYHVVGADSQRDFSGRDRLSSRRPGTRLGSRHRRRFSGRKLEMTVLAEIEAFGSPVVVTVGEGRDGGASAELTVRIAPESVRAQR